MRTHALLFRGLVVSTLLSPTSADAFSFTVERAAPLPREWRAPYGPQTYRRPSTRPTYRYTPGTSRTYDYDYDDDGQSYGGYDDYDDDLSYGNGRRGHRSYGSRSSTPIPRQTVEYRTPHPAGTIVVDTSERRLYLVLNGGKALRYGIGVGRRGFQWTGVDRISAKREWPDWRPPAEMLERQPYLPDYMPGGPDNPLGARALYIGSTEYRIHGSNEPHTIGQAVSSGCIRMTNEDVTDLYERVQVGAKVVVQR